MIRVAQERKAKAEGDAPENMPPAKPGTPPSSPPEQTEAVSEPEMAGLPAKMSSQKVDPATAGYKGPEMGPFACGNCHFFDGNGGCEIVSGPIDPAGLCNNFSAADAPEGEAEGEVPIPEEVLAASPQEPEDGPPQAY